MLILRPGLYETTYGNTALLTSATAKTAKDLDSSDRVPVQLLERFIRPLLKGERP